MIPTECIPFLTSAAVWTCVVPAAALIAAYFRLHASTEEEKSGDRGGHVTD